MSNFIYNLVRRGAGGTMTGVLQPIAPSLFGEPTAWPGVLPAGDEGELASASNGSEMVEHWPSDGASAQGVSIGRPVTNGHAAMAADDVFSLSLRDERLGSHLRATPLTSPSLAMESPALMIRAPIAQATKPSLSRTMPLNDAHDESFAGLDEVTVVPTTPPFPMAAVGSSAHDSVGVAREPAAASPSVSGESRREASRTMLTVAATHDICAVTHLTAVAHRPIASFAEGPEREARGAASKPLPPLAAVAAITRTSRELPDGKTLPSASNIRPRVHTPASSALVAESDSPSGHLAAAQLASVNLASDRREFANLAEPTALAANATTSTEAIEQRLFALPRESGDRGGPPAVQIRIGAIEIRGASPAFAPAHTSPRAIGFDRYASARTHSSRTE